MKTPTQPHIPLPEGNGLSPLFYEKDQAILRYSCNGNLFKVSSLSDFHRPVDSYGFAIKFVTEGTERYTINKEAYAVAAGSYLLLNGEKEAKVAIESKKNVKGICIHIATGVIAEAIGSLTRPDTAFSDPGLASFFYTDHFLENQYSATHTLLGQKLTQIGGTIHKNLLSSEDIHNGLFFELAESLIADQTSVYKQLQAIPTVKSATQRDLCRRLLRGKEFMDTGFTQPLTIDIIAKEAAMSEYHFFRLFKKTFGTSPHQYLLNKRLQAAAALLTTDLSISDIAIECGFTDVFAFSKTFKKRYGVSPSSFSRRK